MHFVGVSGHRASPGRTGFRIVAGLVLMTAVAGAAQALEIDIIPGPNLSGDAAALSAFDRAAAAWESTFTDDITVAIDADLLNLGNPAVIGQTGSVTLAGDYDLIRNQMVVDAGDESDDAIVAFLPSSDEFSVVFPTFAPFTPDFFLTEQIAATKANLKAMGFVGLDAAFGSTDATMQFNDQFLFDFDRSDGIVEGHTDFETVAAHEIGHALGFVSAVDPIDICAGFGGFFGPLVCDGLVVPGTNLLAISPTPLDLFRFEDDTGNPSVPEEFTTMARNLVPGLLDPFTGEFSPAGDAPFIDDLENEYPLSTGAFTGDGRQASHWKDDNLTGDLVGIMDPSLGPQQFVPVGLADARALDLIGWDFDGGSTIPEPATWLLAVLALVAMLAVPIRERRI